jgi:hypothetical protein
MPQPKMPFPGESPTISLAMAAGDQFGFHEEAKKKPSQAAKSAKPKKSAKSAKPRKGAAKTKKPSAPAGRRPR